PGVRLPCIIRFPKLTERGQINDTRISWVDLTPTILDMAGINKGKQVFYGKSFKSATKEKYPVDCSEIFLSHTFHEITMYYPMRGLISGDYKIIWNIAWQLEFPFASDLWASSTWQGIYRGKKDYFGKQKVSDYLNRPKFELYNLRIDPGEQKNLAYDPEYHKILESMKSKLKEWQRKTADPWYIMWDHDNTFQGTGVNL
ncbi:MAG: sulfatase/phosphatase domain-containing protein, partial [Bacteroidales bacterium]